MFVISVRRERVPTPLCVVPDVLERPEPLDDEEDPLEDEPDEEDPLEELPEEDEPAAET